MKFEEEIKVFKATRENTIASLNSLSLDQINEIPEGFTGNVAWHIGHMVATHRGLVYRLNGVAGGFEEAFIAKHKKGSIPESPITQKEFEFITEQLLNQIDELEEDLQKEDFFGKNTSYLTSYGYEMNSLASCVMFNNLHQGVHLGYIMALKHCL